MDWILNPDYGTDTFTVELECFDRNLVAVPLHKDSGGGFDIHLIVVEEDGFTDPLNESWDVWSWNDVEFYQVVKPPKEQP